MDGSLEEEQRQGRVIFAGIEKKRRKSEKASKQGDVRDEQLSSGTVFPLHCSLGSCTLSPIT